MFLRCSDIFVLRFVKIWQTTKMSSNQTFLVTAAAVATAVVICLNSRIIPTARREMPRELRVAQLQEKINWRTQTSNINDNHLKMNTRGTVYRLDRRFFFQVLTEEAHRTLSDISNNKNRFWPHFHSNPEESWVRRVAEYFWRILRYWEMWWNIVLSIRYIFSIGTNNTYQNEKKVTSLKCMLIKITYPNISTIIF